MTLFSEKRINLAVLVLRYKSAIFDTRQKKGLTNIETKQRCHQIGETKSSETELGDG